MNKQNIPIVFKMLVKESKKGGLKMLKTRHLSEEDVVNMFKIIVNSSIRKHNDPTFVEFGDDDAFYLYDRLLREFRKLTKISYGYPQPFLEELKKVKVNFTGDVNHTYAILDTASKLVTHINFGVIGMTMRKDAWALKNMVEEKAQAKIMFDLLGLDETNFAGNLD